MATFSVRIAAVADDAVERSDDTNFTTNPVASFGVGLVYGRSGAAGNPFWYSGFRFLNVTIPQGTTITSAIVTFTARSNFSMTGTNTVALYCENVDDAASYATTADVVNRTRTTATSNWTAPSTGTTDVTADTADFTSSVQEVINRVGWASGNALNVLCRESAGDAGQSGDYYFQEDSTTKSALITITYASAAASTSQLTTLNAG